MACARLSPKELTLIVNTGDDFEWWGLQISPDLDSITYVLADLLSKERGWGVKDDTFLCLRTMEQMDQPAWFQIGDRDLALHLLRTNCSAGKNPDRGHRRNRCEARRQGENPSHEQCTRRDPSRNARRRAQLSGIFRPALVSGPGEIGSLCRSRSRQARSWGNGRHSVRGAVLLAPSNPVTSIGPILAVPGIREALRQTSAPVVAVSPIVGGAAVSGPAGILMAAQGLPVSIAGVAQAYQEFLDILVVDTRSKPGKSSSRGTARALRQYDHAIRRRQGRLARAFFHFFRPKFGDGRRTERRRESREGPVESSTGVSLGSAIIK